METKRKIIKSMVNIDLYKVWDASTGKTTCWEVWICGDYEKTYYSLRAAKEAMGRFDQEQDDQGGEYE